MPRTTRAHQIRIAHLVFGVVLSGGIFVAQMTYAYTPDSPKVRAIAQRAVSYLSSCQEGRPPITEIGGPALIGLAIYKYHTRYFPTDRSVPKRVQQILDGVCRVVRNPQMLTVQNNYSLGITLIFLAEVKPSQHMSEINILISEIQRQQKPNGAWGYAERRTGDTSQTQFPMLGLWSAKNIGAQISDSLMAGAVNWLIRTQDPSGAWGYQGNDPGTYTRVPQSEIRQSRAAAGLSSVYVAADYLHFHVKNRKRKNRKGLPPALIPVEEVDASTRGVHGSVDFDRLRKAMADGNAWFDQHFSIPTNHYQYYYMYALERYFSFKEMIEGDGEEEPAWYNEGVDFIEKMQTAEKQQLSAADDDMSDGFGGYFKQPPGTDVNCSRGIRTAFGCLFLLRSTKATIEKVVNREGILRGGRGLPSDLSEVRQKGGKIVAPAITGKVEDLISMLEDNEADQIENMLDNPDAMSLSGLTTAGKDYTARLQRVLRSGSYKARIVAARILGRQDNLDNVPILIYALTDPDPRVMRAARDALRRISRKFDGFDLPDRPTKPQLDLAIRRWKDWYRSIRPDAVFIQ